MSQDFQSRPPSNVYARQEGKLVLMYTGSRPRCLTFLKKKKEAQLPCSNHFITLLNQADAERKFL
jgi:hypothetical protein